MDHKLSSLRLALLTSQDDASQNHFGGMMNSVYSQPFQQYNMQNAPKKPHQGQNSQKQKSNYNGSTSSKRVITIICPVDYRFGLESCQNILDLLFEVHLVLWPTNGCKSWTLEWTILPSPQCRVTKKAIGLVCGTHSALTRKRMTH
ncbi:hypothetical protein SAY87_020513 [Trapa incisa]|uniref:Uncharacterized protein n=1 Tax=Trapa incisa TaxID=236973 RepID=A0AAN7PU89_9MYRT|nr:hypothetical protein SAY87_020513 [Trapa incisa]